MRNVTKKFLASALIFLTLSGGATMARADDSASPTTSVPKAAKVKNTEYATAMANYRVKFNEYNDAKKAIYKKFQESVRAANTVRKAAHEAATTQVAKKAAVTAFQAAVAAAKSARVAALAALGNPPVKPTK